LVVSCHLQDPAALTKWIWRPPLWSSGQSSWLHNGNVLCFLWGTNWIYICYLEESRPPLWSSRQSSWLQIGDVLCFLWDTNWSICYVEESRPPLWSSRQSSWLQIQRSGFDSRLYQIFWEVGLERGPLSLVSTIEELLERKISGSGLESREYGCRDPSLWTRGSLYPQKLAVTSPTICGRSVGIFCSRTQATEVFLICSRYLLVRRLCWRQSACGRNFLSCPFHSPERIGIAGWIMSARLASGLAKLSRNLEDVRRSSIPTVDLRTEVWITGARRPVHVRSFAAVAFLRLTCNHYKKSVQPCWDVLLAQNSLHPIIASHSTALRVHGPVAPRDSMG
jgi:hypothetical protein